MGPWCKDDLRHLFRGQFREGRRCMEKVYSSELQMVVVAVCITK
jgi:hypothetical protein